VSLYAQALGHTTLENTMAGYAFDEMNKVWGKCDKPSHVGWERIGPLWNSLSTAYAERCRGEVTVYMRAVDEDSVLFKQEFPQLKSMTNEATNNKGLVTLTYKFLLGHNDKDVDEKLKLTPLHMMLVSGVMTVRDVEWIRNNPEVFKRVTKCAMHKDKGCDSSNQLLWPDIQIVFNVLRSHYVWTKRWCQIRFSLEVEDDMTKEDPDDIVVDNENKPKNWDEWTTFEKQKRGFSFWTTAETSTQIPAWGFDIDRVTNDPINTRVHATDPAKKYEKWSAFCRSFLLDQHGHTAVLAKKAGSQWKKFKEARQMKARLTPL